MRQYLIMVLICISLITRNLGVPIMAQWLMNPTRNHQVAGLIPRLTQRVKDPAVL